MTRVWSCAWEAQGQGARHTGRMGKDGEKWLERVEPHFGFLRSLGFGNVDTDDSSFWSIWVQYRSENSAVRISKSNEFVRAEVALIRLVDGEVPPDPIWITDARIDWTLLDNVVEVRVPELMSDVGKQTGLKSSQLEEQLRFWAQILREVAADFLAGSFAPMDEAAALVRSRVAAHPQQVQVWLPEDAPVGAEAQEAGAVQATVPPNVSVSVRRYRRGRDRKSNPK
jgi:hypothetical protein